MRRKVKALEQPQWGTGSGRTYRPVNSKIIDGWSPGKTSPAYVDNWLQNNQSKNIEGLVEAKIKNWNLFFHPNEREDKTVATGISQFAATQWLGTPMGVLGLSDVQKTWVGVSPLLNYTYDVADINTSLGSWWHISTQFEDDKYLVGNIDTNDTIYAINASSVLTPYTVGAGENLNIKIMQSAYTDAADVDQPLVVQKSDNKVWVAATGPANGFIQATTQPTDQFDQLLHAEGTVFYGFYWGGANTKVWKSTDNGANWTNVATLPANDYRTTTTPEENYQKDLADYNPLTGRLTFGLTDSGGDTYIYISDDGGSAWNTPTANAWMASGDLTFTKTSGTSTNQVNSVRNVFNNIWVCAGGFLIKNGEDLYLNTPVFYSADDGSTWYPCRVDAVQQVHDTFNSKMAVGLNIACSDTQVFIGTEISAASAPHDTTLFGTMVTDSICLKP